MTLCFHNCINFDKVMDEENNLQILGVSFGVSVNTAMMTGAFLFYLASSYCLQRCANKQEAAIKDLCDELTDDDERKEIEGLFL
jgi:hypothetical protein